MCFLGEHGQQGWLRDLSSSACCANTTAWRCVRQCVNRTVTVSTSWLLLVLCWHMLFVKLKALVITTLPVSLQPMCPAQQGQQQGKANWTP